MRPIEKFANRILLGDCVKVMGQMPEASVDCVLTDPPYGVSYEDRNGRRVENDDRSNWIAPAFAQMYRVLKPDRFCISFYGWNRVDRFFAAWKGAGFRPVGHVVFAKRYASKERYVAYTHESAYLLAKGNPEKPHMVLRDVLTWQYTGNTRHPTEKPLMAMMLLVDAFSKPGDIVLDPFVGSGTTAVAAKRVGRRYIGIDIEPMYAVSAQDRVRREGRAA
jgi:site-specific DNA-methyltransferase (adenine-specific)